jgi:hypothetical protein
VLIFYFAFAALFQQWRRWASRNRYLSTTWKNVALRWRQLGLSMAFANWRQEAQRLAYKQDSMAKSVLQWTQRALAVAFIKWQSYVERRSRLRQVLTCTAS